VIPDQFGEGFVPDGMDITMADWNGLRNVQVLFGCRDSELLFARMCIIPFVESKTTHLCMEDTDDSGKP
jgi:hypothetical protein